MITEEHTKQACGLIAGLGWDWFDALEELKTECDEVLIEYVRILSVPCDCNEVHTQQNLFDRQSRCHHNILADIGITFANKIFWKRQTGKPINLNWGEDP